MSASTLRKLGADPVPIAQILCAKLGENVHRCWQCVKCTAGCPLADQFDLTPNQVMRALQLGDDTVLASRTIWLCASCHTCATRCPRDINVTAVMDELRIEAKARGVPPAIPEIPLFNAIFMHLVRVFGRLPEALLMLAFNLARGKPLHEAHLGWRMWRSGRLRLVPKFVRVAKAPKPVTPLAHAAHKVGYFPGCAAEGSAADYDRSVRVVARALAIELVEPEGWTCCGSSPAHATDPEQATLMPMRTIATIERMKISTLTTPCSACYSRLKAGEQEVGRDPAKAERVAASLGYQYEGGVRVQHLVDTLMERAGTAKVSSCVVRPLAGLKVACYYGCLITRPVKITAAEHPEYPMQMDQLMRALGAEPVAWSGKTECCGGGLGVIHSEPALILSRRVLANARDCGADLVATMCPMCHMNLELRQPQLGFASPTPIVHATQLMALAFGLGEAATLSGDIREFTENVQRPSVHCQRSVSRAGQPVA